MKIVLELILNFIKVMYAFRWILLIIFIVYLFRYLPFIIKYYKSNYKKESDIGILKFLLNIGYFGEGITFIELEKIPIYSKILPNLYIPTEDGTTEMDLVYITTSGVYVIESKNYSGWIYGSYKQKEWMSNIYGRKYRFYNPIWQNNNHIKSLEKVLPNIKLNSLIVFSERCQLKKVNVDKKLVIKRNELKDRILMDKENKVLSKEEVDNIYNKLKQYGNKTNKEKKEHINRIKQNIK